MDLGGHGGNPELRTAKTGDEIWANDYDTMVAIDSRNLHVLRSRRLQGVDDRYREFIGDYSFAPDGKLLFVARPFSGDIVAVRSSDLDVVGSATLGRQPLECAVLKSGDVVARDWKTGDVLFGEMKPTASADFGSEQ